MTPDFPGTQPSEEQQQVTRLLEELRSDPELYDQIIPVIYHDLRQVARSQRARFKVSATLQTTVLVHEAFLKLRKSSSEAPESRRHMMRLAVMAMRQLIVDHARQKLAGKRGSGLDDITLNEELSADFMDARSVLEVDHALTRMEAHNPRLASLVIARFFGGYTLSEVAELMDTSRRTVSREWQRARAWLLVELDREGTGDGEED